MSLRLELSAGGQRLVTVARGVPDFGFVCRIRGVYTGVFAKQVAKADCWQHHVCPSVRIRTKCLAPDGFSLNFVFGNSVKNCPQIQIFVKSEQRDAVEMKTSTYLL